MTKESEGKRGVDFGVLGNRSLHCIGISSPPTRCGFASTSRLKTLTDHGESHHCILPPMFRPTNPVIYLPIRLPSGYATGVPFATKCQKSEKRW